MCLYTKYECQLRNPEGHYILTAADIEAYQRMLDATYDLDIRSCSEREFSTYGYWKVVAPARDRVYYTADGYTLASAIEKWFSYIKEMGTEPYFGE